MRKMRWAGAAAILALGGVTTGASAAVLECTYQKGFIEIYKITPDSWQEWDNNAWTWHDRACYGKPADYNGLDTLPCNVSVDSDYYRWSQNGDGGQPEIEATSSYRSSLSIDRQTGVVKWSWSSHAVWRILRKIDDHGDSAEGTCKVIVDPALKPKPAPKL